VTRPAAADERPIEHPPSTATQASSVIGLLGGSFDPIHRGHLQLARDAQAQLHLTQVRFLLAGRPWQKSEPTGAAHRAAMVLAAIGGEPRFTLDLREVERPGPTYTIDTLRELRAELGDEVPLVLIIGSDQFERLDTWRNWNRLLDHAHLAVARRADAVLAPNWTLQEFFNAHWAPRPAVAQSAHGRIVEIDMTPVDASATEIRELLALPDGARRDARLAEVLPAAVLDYIRAHRLYR
jgi:nicotinate-nucleotide adenylyltransferase